MRARQVPWITVGVGKTHLACALGHIAIRRRRGVHMARAGKLFKRLKAARLDNTLDYEMRRLATVELLIIDLCRSGDYADTALAGAAAPWPGRASCFLPGHGDRHSHRLSRKASVASGGL